MKIKALVSFSGAFSMHKGEVKECNDKVVLQDLLQAGYVEKAKEKPKEKEEKTEESEEVTETTEKGGNKNESKRNTSK